MYLSDLIKDDASYAFAAGEIKSVEGRLFSKTQIERFPEISIEEILRTLQDSGYSFDSFDPADVEKGLEEKRLSSMLFFEERMLNNNILLFFKAKHDFHNIKIIKKSILAGNADYQRLLLPGTIHSDMLELSLKTGDYEKLPFYMKSLFPDIVNVFTDINQIFDMENFIDKIYFKESSSIVKKSKSKWMEHYLKTLIDITNIKNYIRYIRMKKSHKGFDKIVLDGGYITESFYLKEKEAMSSLIKDLPEKYREIMIEGLKVIEENRSFASVEKNAENLFDEILESVRYDISSAEMLIAYYLRQQREINLVSLILFAKFGGMPDKEIKEYL